MSRPKDADSATTYDTILEAARALVFVSGDGPHTDISMRKVATRAGVSVGTVSYYFPSKELLLERCLDVYYAQLDDEIAALFAEVGRATTIEPRDFVARVTRLLYRRTCVGRAEVLLRVATDVARGGHHSERRDNFLRQYLDTGASVLARIAEIPEIEARLTIYSTNVLVTRYVAMSDDDLEVVLGSIGPAARRQLEDHVVRAAVKLAVPGAPRHTTRSVGCESRVRGQVEMKNAFIERRSASQTPSRRGQTKT